MAKGILRTHASAPGNASFLVPGTGFVEWSALFCYPLWQRCYRGPKAGLLCEAGGAMKLVLWLGARPR